MIPFRSAEVQTDPVTLTSDTTMKGNLARSSCFEESRSYSDVPQVPNGGLRSSSSSTSRSNAAAAKLTPASNGNFPFVHLFYLLRLSVRARQILSLNLKKLALMDCTFNRLRCMKYFPFSLSV